MSKLRLLILLFNIVLFTHVESQAGIVRLCRVLFPRTNTVAASDSRSEARPERAVGTLTEAQIRENVGRSKQYLDHRNEEWTERHRCLCCHTTLPYMMSRGVDAQSIELFDKYQRMAADKVENAAASPWYQADRQGRNSKPTEAVVNALTLLNYDIAKGSPLSAVTLKSVDRIFENLDADGHIHWLDFNLEPFESKNGELWGNSMAVLAIEMAVKHSNYRPQAEPYARLKNYLKQNGANLKSQEMSVLLWANSQNNGSSRGGEVLSREQQNNFFAHILSEQNADGSWSQKSFIGRGVDEPQAYVTAMGLIALISAKKGNTPQAHKAAEWLMAQQSTAQVLNFNQPYTFWQGRSMNRTAVQNNRFASDFSTSYASIALQMYRTEITRRSHP
jgi:hypothetical protein